MPLANFGTRPETGLSAGCQLHGAFGRSWSSLSSGPGTSYGPVQQRQRHQRCQVLCAGLSRPQAPKQGGGGGSNARRGGPSRPNRPRPQPQRQQQRPPPRQPQRQQPPAPQQDGRRGGRQSNDDPPMNSDITCAEVRVLDSKKEMIGVVSTSRALEMATEQDVDLVLIGPDAEPPLARLVELNKLKFEQAKADKNQRRKQRENRQELKELKFRPNTDVHDYNVRLKNAKKFLSKGDKVKLTMQFKGREMEFKNLGKEMFERFIGDLGEEASVAQNASMHGYSMTLIVTPNKK